MATIWAAQALTDAGWARDVRIDIGADGTITAVEAGAPAAGEQVSVLLAAPTNLHSHAFQRAMAGLTERRGPDPKDTFWTWRQLMFRFLDHLTPDDVEAITALVQMEMLEAGFAAVVEFHYLHHQPGGRPYEKRAEMSERIAAAACETGIGLTLLPVFYRYGGCDLRPLGPGQVRFGNTPDQFAALYEDAGRAIAHLAPDARLGIAPHSLRAVSPEDLAIAVALAGSAPIHMHLAEQPAEVDEVLTHRGARPADWLLENFAVDARWCLIHCTQLVSSEIDRLAGTGAVVGLCPITESSLGDGIFDAVRLLSRGGRFGVGSDSNIRISLAEELRTLEYSQRLRDRARAVLATPTHSTGRVLFDQAVRSGATAAGRNSGALAVGRLADIVALDGSSIDFEGKTGDALIDSFVFTQDSGVVQHVWSAGRHVVQNGRHVARAGIVTRYAAAMRALRSRL